MVSFKALNISMGERKPQERMLQTFCSVHNIFSYNKDQESYFLSIQTKGLHSLKHVIHLSPRKALKSSFTGAPIPLEKVVMSGQTRLLFKQQRSKAQTQNQMCCTRGRISKSHKYASAAEKRNPENHCDLKSRFLGGLCLCVPIHKVFGVVRQKENET